MTAVTPDIASLLPLFQIRLDAPALAVAKALGPGRAAEHLRAQVTAGLVQLPFHNTTIAVKVFEAAAVTPTEGIAANLLAASESDLALKMALDELPGGAGAIQGWLTALTPVQAPVRATVPRAARSPLPVAGDAPALVLPRNLGDAKAGLMSLARQPLAMAFVAGFLGMGAYKTLTPESQPNLALGGSQQEQRAAADDGSMFPGSSTNPSFNPNLKPIEPEVLPTPQVPDPSKPDGAETPKAAQ